MNPWCVVGNAMFHYNHEVPLGNPEIQLEAYLPYTEDVSCLSDCNLGLLQNLQER